MNKNAITLPTWIIIWLGISMMINFWDVLYIILRPASFEGGSLGAIWIPYAKYIKIDISYADLQNDFINSIPFMNLFEISIGSIALFLNYIRKGAAAMVFAFSSLLLTGTKTILVFVMEWVSGLKHVGHNSISDLILFYILPNAIWIIFPFLAVLTLGRILMTRLEKNMI